MAKGHRSQIKRARNESNRETRPCSIYFSHKSVNKFSYINYLYTRIVFFYILLFFYRNNLV